MILQSMERKGRGYCFSGPFCSADRYISAAAEEEGAVPKGLREEKAVRRESSAERKQWEEKAVRRESSAKETVGIYTA